MPWTTSLESFYRGLMRLDVGLAPVEEQTSPLGRYRSDLKPLEYAMAGALPIVSDATPYSGWRGRLPMADSPDGFVERVRWAVGNREEVREQAARVREFVLAERTVGRNVWRWLQALGRG